MYKRILLNNKLSFKERLKRFLNYYLRVRGARILWNGTFGFMFKEIPDYAKPVDADTEKQHRLYWKPFRTKSNMRTLRLNANISGNTNYKYIPEEIFTSDIEPTLNPEINTNLLAVKSFYNNWYGEGIFPLDYFHNIGGEWLNPKLEHITFEEMKTIAKDLDYPVVLKPNKDSFGGKGVYFPKSYDELMKIAESKSNFVVQQKIVQHEFLQQFNPHGLNTVRVNVYKSVKDDQLHVVNVVFRMGVGGSLDNVTSGGIACLVNKDGVMDGLALDLYARKYTKHPDNNLSFDKEIPDFEQLKEVALKVASKIFYARVMCLDLCYDENGKWKMVEVNGVDGTSICFPQWYGYLFFDEFTDEVREYCIDNHWGINKNIQL